tara:strand:- start:9 stop:311 length:303 start_codon:yes stop_codon:yes gene_type:complete
MRLINPTHITGVISTPPMGGMNFRVVAKTGSVGHTKKSQKPLLVWTCGYHVRMILIKKAKVKKDRRNPSNRLKVGKACKKADVTNLKACIDTSYKAAVNH